MEAESARLGIAFALVVLAGLCAPLGASVVVFMRKSHTGLLAASIALAAGVMVFISLTEVLSDSMTQLEHGGWSATVRNLYTYMAFFGGVVLCRLLDLFADKLMHCINKFSQRHRTNSSGAITTTSSSSDLCTAQRELCSMHDVAHLGGSKDAPLDPTNAPIAASKQQVLVTDVEEGLSQSDLLSTGSAAGVPAGHATNAGMPAVAFITHPPPEDEHDQAIAAAVRQLTDESCGHLVRTSILVWLALSLHNLPEGLATMVGYMSSPHLGVTVAVAIAIHNIPEGIALGVPVFFATGSRWKAVGWAALSGAAEPLGALIGLALQLTGQLNPVAMGIIMAVVAGVMTGIAFQELLPRALSFDPANKYTTTGVFAGMGIMAFSLVLLSLWDAST